ncbi:hypothetical protein GCM10027269_84470 [Kribbella endophytica]
MRDRRSGAGRDLGGVHLDQVGIGLSPGSGRRFRVVSALAAAVQPTVHSHATARETRRRAEVRHLDLEELPSAVGAVDEQIESLGGVDVLVANSGTGTSKLAIDLEYDEWRKVISVDLDGACCACDWPHGG